ncbi:hypothetical protein CASFOL_037347 [Castilleja foliolosa]|uniref:Uncharacterized protein n=1 Tax=Castilleja foliolosa TaxID=1961234 RepID=A0ABD3BNH2_9LAMI
MHNADYTSVPYYQHQPYSQTQIPNPNPNSSQSQSPIEPLYHAPPSYASAPPFSPNTYPTLANTTVEDWDAIFQRQRQGGFLTCGESVLAAALPGYSAYAASKAAVEAMTKDFGEGVEGKERDE